jgi:hypothetical protein
LLKTTREAKKEQMHKVAVKIRWVREEKGKAGEEW